MYNLLPLPLLSLCVQDFFHNPPSYQAKVKLSWGAEVSHVTCRVVSTNPNSHLSPLPSQKPVLQRKRPSGASAATVTNQATPPKRKPSPIRFESSDSGGKSSAGKRETRSLYQPPRDRFSKNVDNGSFGEGRGQRGRGKGRGRGGRGRGTWRVY